MPVDIGFTLSDEEVAKATTIAQLAEPDLSNAELKALLDDAAKKGAWRQLKEWQRTARRNEYRAANAADDAEFAEAFNYDAAELPD